MLKISFKYQSTGHYIIIGDNLSRFGTIKNDGKVV